MIFFPTEVIFHAHILTKCIDNRHLVCLTPRMVLYIVHFIIVHSTPFFQRPDINSSNKLVY